MRELQVTSYFLFYFSPRWECFWPVGATRLMLIPWNVEFTDPPASHWDISSQFYRASTLDCYRCLVFFFLGRWQCPQLTITTCIFFLSCPDHRSHWNGALHGWHVPRPQHPKSLQPASSRLAPIWRLYTFNFQDGNRKICPLLMPTSRHYT